MSSCHNGAPAAINCLLTYSAMTRTLKRATSSVCINRSLNPHFKWVRPCTSPILPQFAIFDDALTKENKQILMLFYGSKSQRGSNVGKACEMSFSSPRRHQIVTLELQQRICQREQWPVPVQLHYSWTDPDFVPWFKSLRFAASCNVPAAVDNLKNASPAGAFSRPPLQWFLLALLNLLLDPHGSSSSRAECIIVCRKSRCRGYKFTSLTTSHSAAYQPHLDAQGCP